MHNYIKRPFKYSYNYLTNWEAFLANTDYYIYYTITIICDPGAQNQS